LPWNSVAARGGARLGAVCLVGLHHPRIVEGRAHRGGVHSRDSSERRLDRVVLVEQRGGGEPRELQGAKRGELAVGVREADGDDRPARAAGGDHPGAGVAGEGHPVAGKAPVAEGGAHGRVAPGDVLLGALGQPDHHVAPAQPGAVAPAQHREGRTGRVGPRAARVGEVGDLDHGLDLPYPHPVLLVVCRVLLAVPNVSEGRDTAVIARIGEAFASPRGVRLLDVHRDPDHHRSVFTLAGEPGELAFGLAAGARVALEEVDLGAHAGVHPHVGALDVAPIVHLSERERGAACVEALVAADELGRLDLPVFLYGVFADGRTRAELRRGGPEALAERIAVGELRPDFGPPRLHPTGGATLVAARPPLVAFNLELAPPATLADARRIAAAARADAKLPGVRALGLELSSRGAVQLSFNVEDPVAVPLVRLVEAVREHAAIARAELVGLAPEAALAGFPSELTLPNFDPERHLIERALARG